MSGSVPPPIHSRAVTAIAELLGRERLMTLACNGPDGWPHATTVGYVNEGLNLYFVVARTSRKFVNLQVDPRAAVAIRFEGGEQGDGVGVYMTGRVAEVVDPEAIERLNRQVAERYPDIHVYCPSSDAVAVLHFRPTVISSVGVAHGRSTTEIFTVGEPHARGVSELF